MPRNRIWIDASPDAVFDVFDDACAYPRWVVGARRVRGVDREWPAVGSRFHHALGTAAGELHDSSKVLERDRPRRMVLEVRFRPTGVATVALDVAAEGTGSVVVIDETLIRGPVARLPRLVTEPLLKLRNTVSLRRLRHAVDRSRGPSSTT